MNFKEIFDKEIIVEEHIRKRLKIFYEIDLNLIKPKQEETAGDTNDTAASNPQVNNDSPQQTPQAETQVGTSQPTTTSQTSVEQPSGNIQQPAENNQQPNNKPDMSGIFASVQTEEDNASKNSEENIMRHFKGEYTCETEQADNIQTFDDLVDILGSTKKDGVNILDDFCKEIITLCANQRYEEIKTKLDKKSKIFVEIYFGYKKDDSIGVRFKKPENSDSLSSSILIDNQIVTLTKFNIERVNQKIIEYRNYEMEKA